MKYGDGERPKLEKNVMQNAMLALFRRAGVGNEIIPFVNGTDALNYLLGDDRSGAASAKRQQLILLDLNLPDMTGIDILQKLKGNKHTKRSPIVVLTTTDDSREIQRCYDLGANVYITKPVNYEGFANAWPRALCLITWRAIRLGSH